MQPVEVGSQQVLRSEASGRSGHPNHQTPNKFRALSACVSCSFAAVYALRHHYRLHPAGPLPARVCGLKGLCATLPLCSFSQKNEEHARTEEALLASCCLRVIFPAQHAPSAPDILNFPSLSIFLFYLFHSFASFLPFFIYAFSQLQIALIYIILRTFRRIVCCSGVCIFFDSCQEVISWNFARCRRLVCIS